MSLITPDFGLLFWMTLIFAIVFIILAKFGFPIITKMVKKRSDYIGKSLSDAREAEERLKSLAQQKELMIDEARREQSRILNEAADERDKIVSEAREQARRETSLMIEKARLEIEAQKESAMREVRRQAATLSVAVAEKLLRRSLESDSRQESLIDTLISEALKKQSGADRAN